MLDWFFPVSLTYNVVNHLLCIFSNISLILLVILMQLVFLYVYLQSSPAIFRICRKLLRKNLLVTSLLSNNHRNFVHWILWLPPASTYILLRLKWRPFSDLVEYFYTYFSTIIRSNAFILWKVVWQSFSYNYPRFYY